jgi:hypothetical protein
MLKLVVKSSKSWIVKVAQHQFMGPKIRIAPPKLSNEAKLDHSVTHQSE